jgi:hypothetical protein
MERRSRLLPGFAPAQIRRRSASEAFIGKLSWRMRLEGRSIAQENRKSSVSLAESTLLPL